MLGEADESSAPLRVLIAEDETIIRMDLRVLLERNGMMVVAEAGDGAEAVDLDGAKPPKPIFMSLPSRSSDTWNLRVEPRADGSIDVRGADV